MAHYRARPATCEAFRFTGDTGLLAALGVDWTGESTHNRDVQLWVEKSHSYCALRPGDYVMREPDGDGFYPCVAEVFDARWEPVEVVEKFDHDRATAEETQR